MGFYAPAQIVRDATRHGVEARHPDINKSDWDCSLEKQSDGSGTSAHPALRLGLRLIDGLRKADVEKLTEA